MDEITVKKSGSSMPIKNPVLVKKNESFESDFKALVQDAQNLIDQDNAHFENCLFRTEDLLSITNQAECKNIMFAHVAGENLEVPNQSFSTLIAMGVKDKGFIWSEEIYISAEFNKNIDYNTISFNVDNNLEIIYSFILTPPVNIEFPRIEKVQLDTPTSGESLAAWLERSLQRSQEIIKAGNSDPENYETAPLIYGIYFNTNELNKLALLNTSEYIALLPINMNVEWKNKNNEDWAFPINTYIIAPVVQRADSEIFDLVYPNGGSIASRSSDDGKWGAGNTSWPEEWEV